MKNRKGQLGYIDVRMTRDNRKMARIRYWEDVAGQHKRKRRSTEWQDVTDWSDQQIQLWRMQVIAEAGVQDPKKPIPSEVDFESHAIAWLEQNLTRYKKSFRKSLVMFVHRYLIPAFGAMPIEEITGPVVNKWVGSVRLQNGAAPSRQTLRHLVKTLQIIVGKPFASREIRYPADARPKRRIYCPTDEEVRNIVSRAKGVYRVLFAMAPSTGMRAGELYGLHIEDIDFEHGCILVRQSFSGGEMQSPKTEKSHRVITINPDLVEMIRRYKGERTKGVLLLSEAGTPLHHENVLHRHLHPIQRSLDLPRFGMHSFRHYSVSYCIRHGMSFDDVRLRHGHGSEEIMRLYLHLAPGHDARVLRMIPNIAAEVGPSVGPSNIVQLRQAV